MKAKLMTEISAKEFGELQSDVKYLKGQSDKQEEKLDSIGDSLNSSLSAEDMQRMLEPIITNQATHNRQLADHETRLKYIEDREQLREASIWRKIGKATENNFVKWVSTAVLLVVMWTAYVVIQEQGSLPVQVIERVER